MQKVIGNELKAMGKGRGEMVKGIIKFFLQPQPLASCLLPVF